MRKKYKIGYLEVPVSSPRPPGLTNVRDKDVESYAMEITKLEFRKVVQTSKQSDQRDKQVCSVSVYLRKCLWMCVSVCTRACISRRRWSLPGSGEMS